MPQHCFRELAFIVCTLPAIGCGAEYAADGTNYSSSPDMAATGAAPGGDSQFVAFQAAADEAADPDAPPIQRKIIYTARLDVVVEQFDPVPAQVEQLAQAHGAFISNSSIDTASGRPRSGTWTIRVPVGRYAQLLQAADELGELQRRTEDSQEVTAEYFDVQTRLRNKEREEERLLEHLASATGTLEEILAVEKELARVRTESEQLAGRLRMLNDLTSLSTVTIHVSEIRGYVPVESPTFATRIGRVWSQSLAGLLDVGQGLVLAAVALIPWAIVCAIPTLALIALLKRRSRPGRSGTRESSAVSA